MPRAPAALPPPPPRPRSPAPCAAASVGPARASPRRSCGHRPRHGRHLCFRCALPPAPPPPPPRLPHHVSSARGQWQRRLGRESAGVRANGSARASKGPPLRRWAGRGRGPRESRRDAHLGAGRPTLAAAPAQHPRSTSQRQLPTPTAGCACVFVPQDSGSCVRGSRPATRRGRAQMKIPAGYPSLSGAGPLRSPQEQAERLPGEGTPDP